MGKWSEQALRVVRINPAGLDRIDAGVEAKFVPEPTAWGFKNRRFILLEIGEDDDAALILRRAMKGIDDG